jgi:hypothetical protein
LYIIHSDTFEDVQLLLLESHQHILIDLLLCEHIQLLIVGYWI